MVVGSQLLTIMDTQPVLFHFYLATFSLKMMTKQWCHHSLLPGGWTLGADSRERPSRAQFGTFKLAMETQINTVWFDSAWPKVLMEMPHKTHSHCVLTKRTVWHFLSGFNSWFYLSISRHLKPFGCKFRLKNKHTAYIVYRDIVVKMIGQWE